MLGKLAGEQPPKLRGRVARLTRSRRRRELLQLVLGEVLLELAREALQEAESQGLVGDEALMAAFEANKNDAARVSGN